MNTDSLTSSYDSPLRAAQKEETRRRILDAAGRLIETQSPAGLSFGAIAREAGVQERTVYRHFPTKDALMAALWQWLDPRIGARSFPASEADLVALPLSVFPAFDEHEHLVRAMWTTPQGRDIRLAANPKRKAAMRAAVAAAVEGLAPGEAAAITAAAQLLYSAAAWMTMKDYWGMDGTAAGRASSLALSLLLKGARDRAAASAAAPRRPRKTGDAT